MNSGSAVPSPQSNSQSIEIKPLRASAFRGLVAVALTAIGTLVPAVARAQTANGDGNSQGADSRNTRALLLRQHLSAPAAAGSAAAERYLGAIFGTTYVGLGVGVAIADFNEDPGRRWVAVGVTGGLALASFSSYVVPDRWRRPVLESLVGLNFAGLGAFFITGDHNTGATRFTFASMIATGVLLEGLVIWDAALQEHAIARKLELGLRRLERGDSLSMVELRDLEREFSLTARPVPRWAFPAVLTVGAMAAAAPALVGGTSKDDRQIALLFSSFMLFTAGSIIVPALSSERSGYRAYLRGLRGVQLAPLGPENSAGLTLLARF